MHEERYCRALRKKSGGALDGGMDGGPEKEREENAKHAKRFVLLLFPPFV